MKAIICRAYGPPEVLTVAEVPTPTNKDDEVLIRVRASAVTQSDIFIRGSKLPLRMKVLMRLMIGIRSPRQPVLGLVLAGEVIKTGEKIRRFKPGDRVYGLTGFTFGSYAEYKCMKETDSTRGCLALMPESMGYEDATTAAYGGLLALQYLERGKIQPGHRVLIYGASGTTGTTAVQLAKHFGAWVTAVCSTRNIDLVRSLGADQVIDYTQTHEIPDGMEFDFILDAVGGMKTSRLKKSCKKALVSGGRYVSIDDGALKLVSDRLVKIAQWVDEGHLKPFTEKVYTMENIVEAHRYVESGHKRGGVSIRIGK